MSPWLWLVSLILGAKTLKIRLYAVQGDYLSHEIAWGGGLFRLTKACGQNYTEVTQCKFYAIAYTHNLVTNPIYSKLVVTEAI